MQTLLERLPDLELFAHFVELDAANEGKDLTFLWWFRRELAISRTAPRRIRRPVRTGTERTSSTSRHSPPSRTSSRPSRMRRASSSPSSGPRCGAEGEVLTSDDGLRVWLVWRWHGSRRELIERDADVVRERTRRAPDLRPGARRRSAHLPRRKGPVGRCGHAS